MREMKDSGIEFIGIIPDNWEIRRMKTLGNVRNGITYSPQDVTDEESGILVLRSSNIKNGKLCFTDNVYVSCSIPSELKVKNGDILICSRNGSRELIGKNAIINNVNATFGAFMMIFRCGTPNYLYYVLNSPVFSYYLGSFFTSTINQLTGYNFGNMKVAYCNDKEEQDRISYFLDLKCTEIDSLISDIQSQIETLEEYKRSVITEAVTKGLDPDVEMKDSGVQWMGKIPKHWTVDNPKWHFVQRKDRATKGLTQLTASQKYGVVTQEEYMEITGAKVVTVEKDFDILKLVCPGDFIIHMRSFQGGLEYSEKYGSISSAYVMLIPQKTILEPRFYKWFFKSPVYIDALSSTSNLIRDGQAMRYANFIQLPIPLMPKEEQQQIADYLDSKCAEIDSIIAEKKQQIETIEEYKKSMIFEYVTGKKEVVK